MTDWADKLSSAEKAEFWGWIAHQEGVVLPALEDSRVVMSIAPSGKPDAKFCVELGFALMLGKPLILLVDRDAAPVPDKLRRVADEVVEVSMRSKDPAVMAADGASIKAAMARLGAGK